MNPDIQPKESPDLPKYKCHKVVEGVKIHDLYEGKDDGKWWIVPADAEVDSIEVSRAFIDKHNPKPNGYYVRYEDGYESYSPAEPFENGYIPLPREVLNPMFNKVIVEPESDKEKKVGNLILPPKVAEGNSGQYGVVVAVGPGLWNESSPQPRRIPMTVKVGDRVMFNRHAGIDEKFHGRKIKTIYETDIWRIVD